MTTISYIERESSELSCIRSTSDYYIIYRESLQSCLVLEAPVTTISYIERESLQSCLVLEAPVTTRSYIKRVFRVVLY